ncbi:MAG: phosphotransferase [Chloroflexi bacterium]|nr:phosphotransferase [Chloroflexota bacterium]
MLDTTLKTRFVPGTHLKGYVSGGNWVFLLPSLELEQIVCIGVLSFASIDMLSRTGRCVWIVSSNTNQLNRAVATWKHITPKNVNFFVSEDGISLPFPSQTSDLVVIAGRKGLSQFQRNPRLLWEVRRVLKSNGLLYLEVGGVIGDRFDKKSSEHIIDYFGGGQLFWLTPSNGEMQTAVPLSDCETINYFLNHSLYSPSIKWRYLGPIEHLWNKNPVLARLTRRYGLLGGSGALNTIDQPPAYLQTIMREAGLKSDRYRWGLVARGNYNSRKVLFYLFDRATGSPEYIVKMTRDPLLNFRLENEYRSLTRMKEKGIGDQENLPQLVFQGHHAGLAIIGETLINGVAFRTRTQATADCPYASAAIHWLTRLGRETADHSTATSDQVTRHLRTLFERFRELYSLAPDEQEFMAEQIAEISNNVQSFPLVFQHGNPGIWNVLVTPHGGIVFIDWEAAETQGMPLWDLLYFLRSYSVWVARSRGTRNPLKGFERQFLLESPLSRTVVESVERYCHQIDLPGSLVQPLFYTCWMHQALTEATRLPPDGLEKGGSIKLLRLCIAKRDAPTLRNLFSLNSTNNRPVEHAQGAYALLTETRDGE